MTGKFDSTILYFPIQIHISLNQPLKNIGFIVNIISNRNFRIFSSIKTVSLGKNFIWGRLFWTHRVEMQGKTLEISQKLWKLSKGFSSFFSSIYFCINHIWNISFFSCCLWDACVTFKRFFLLFKFFQFSKDHKRFLIIGSNQEIVKIATEKLNQSLHFFLFNIFCVIRRVGWLEIW